MEILKAVGTTIKLFIECVLLNPYLIGVYASGLLIKSLGCFNKKWKY